MNALQIGTLLIVFAGVFGGALLGGVLEWLVSRAMRRLDDY